MSTPPAEQTTSGKRRQRLGEDERREQIVRAAIDVVAEEGFAAASVTRIAKRAGISKGLVFHYFADKGDVMEQALKATAVTIREAVAADLDLTAPVTEVIRAAIRRAAALSSTHSKELNALNQITQNLRTPDGAPRLDLTAYEDTYQAQEALFRRGQDEGSLRRFDTRVMAITYQGAIDMMLAYFEAHPNTDLDRYADALADILLVGMAKHPEKVENPEIPKPGR
ncbi:TetR/AcrR family transcriptional regulator [Streptomyces sp. NPDC056669]|uniref:TetR/AcrR family transcriptional regulator n=1 Tax=unclassified Streptomyces TaxID=2593676 RepID=UPI0036CA686F